MTTAKVCTFCDGNGCEYGCGNCHQAHQGPTSHRICRKCNGTGREAEK